MASDGSDMNNMASDRSSIDKMSEKSKAMLLAEVEKLVEKIETQEMTNLLESIKGTSSVESRQILSKKILKLAEEAKNAKK